MCPGHGTCHALERHFRHFYLGGDPGDNEAEVIEQWAHALSLPGVRGLVVGRSMLYPASGAAKAVDAAGHCSRFVDFRKRNKHDQQHRPHWINGARDHGTTDRTGPSPTRPYGKETKRVVPRQPGPTSRKRSRALHAAYPEWRDTSIARRQAVLFNFRELLNSKKGELAEILTAEHGKVLSDALGEISRGQEVVEFAC